MLALLDDLDIRDKHRLLTVAGLVPNGMNMPLSGLVPGASCSITTNIGPLKNDTPLMTITTSVPAPDMKVDGSATVAIILAQPDLPPIGLVDLGLLLRRSYRSKPLPLCSGTMGDIPAVPVLPRPGPVLSVHEIPPSAVTGE